MVNIKLRYEEDFITLPDGSVIHVVECRPIKKTIEQVKRVIHYIPGSFENANMTHIKALAENMVACYGCAVVIVENPGHGGSTNPEGVPFFTKSIDIPVENHRMVGEKLRKKYCNAKIACVGFSFGSIVAKMLIMKYPELYDGAAFIGSSHQDPIAVNIAILFAKLAAKLAGGYDKPSALINKLTNYGPGLAKKLSQLHGKEVISDDVFYWICHYDAGRKAFELEVGEDKEMRVGMFASMMAGMKYTVNQKNINQVPDGFKVFFGSGEWDSAGNYGAGVTAAKKAFTEAGADTVMCIYKKAFHAILAEECASEVYNDLGTWMQAL